jgi:hypothetical protein
MAAVQSRGDFAMPGRWLAALRLLAIGLAASSAAGCQPAEVGSIPAPALDRSQGPTINPNSPGAESVIPAENIKSRGKSGAGRPKG